MVEPYITNDRLDELSRLLAKATPDLVAQRFYAYSVTVLEVASRHALGDLLSEIRKLQYRVKELENAIKEHRGQRADDRCQFDDDKLYAAVGDGILCDRHVGSKEAMLKNCVRYVLSGRCEEGGPWKTYAELEKENEALRQQVKDLEGPLDACGVVDLAEIAQPPPLDPLRLGQKVWWLMKWYLNDNGLQMWNICDGRVLVCDDDNVAIATRHTSGRHWVKICPRTELFLDEITAHTELDQQHSVIR